jgi:hypothetical protein
MRLLISCNNIPDTVQKMFAELDKDSITYLEVNSKVPKKLKTDTLFLLSFSDFKRNLVRLNSEEYLKKTVVLFAPIVKVKYLTHAYFLDVKSDKGMYSITSEYKNLCIENLERQLSKPFKKRTVKEENTEFKYLLIDGVRSGSLLNPLMTLLYSVKAEGSVKIKEMVLSWLVSPKQDIASLSKQLKSSYEWGTVSSKFCGALIELLSSDLGQRYKMVLSKIEAIKATGEKPNTVALAKKHEVDDYELRYILNNLINTRKHLLDSKTVDYVHAKQKKRSAEKKALAEAEAESEE